VVGPLNFSYIPREICSPPFLEDPRRFLRKLALLAEGKVNRGTKENFFSYILIYYLFTPLKISRRRDALLIITCSGPRKSGHDSVLVVVALSALRGFASRWDSGVALEERRTLFSFKLRNRVLARSVESDLPKWKRIEF